MDCCGADRGALTSTATDRNDGRDVETSLGITATVNVAAVLAGVDYPDLDTAFLLAADPFICVTDARTGA